jgi:lysophospholipase
MTHLFHEIPGNPLPEHAAGGFLTSADGRKLRYACFGAAAHPVKGTVILLTGRNECIEKYFETIRDLAQRGLGVAILDWRGQGGSERSLRDAERGYVKSFRDYARDLDQFFGEVVLPDCRGPYYVLAHSSGALIALLATPSMVNRVRRMVLIAPFLALPGQPVSMRAVRRVTGLLCLLGLGHLYVSGGPRAKQRYSFDTNKVTSDASRYRRNRLIYETFPQLALGGPTVRWLHGACETAGVVSDPGFMTANSIPTLIVAAGADRVVSSKAVEDYARRLRLGSLVTIDGARHEILQEADFYREQFLAAFDAFIPGSDAETP